MTACSSNNNEPSAAAPADESKSDQTAGNTGDAESERIQKYDPPIEITTVRSTDDLIERLLSKLPGETLEDNRFTRDLLDEYGIKVKYNWIAKGGEEYKQKVNLSLASGEMPDYISFGQLSQVKQAHDAGYLQDIKPLFDKYASDLTKQVFETDGGLSFAATTFDGFVGALPLVAPAYDSVTELFIRKDWLDNLGLAEPKNHEDVLQIMKAFKERDPDQNGKNDTFGTALVQGLFTSPLGDLRGFFNAYHAYPTAWYEAQDGNLIYGSIQPEMKPALAKLREMYAAGHIDKEFGVKNETKVAEDVAAGKIGLLYHKDWGPFWPLNVSHDNDNNAMWYAYPLMSVDSQPAKSAIWSGANGWVGISAEAEHPEAIVQMLNMYIEKNWGETADAGKYFGGGDTEGLWKLSPIAILHPDNNFLILEGVKHIMNNGGSTEGVASNAVSMYDSIMKYRNGDHSNWSFEAVYAPNPWSTIEVTKVYQDSNPPVPAFTTWTQTIEDKGAVVDKILNDAFTKIIIGESDISSFDTAVADWKKQGGEQITKEMNEWYVNAKK